MYYVYILRSDVCSKQIYIGFSTVDMDVRLGRHNAGSTPATKRYRPWSVVWYSAFVERGMALTFEEYLKSGSGRAFLHKRLIH